MPAARRAAIPAPGSPATAGPAASGIRPAPDRPRRTSRSAGRSLGLLVAGLLLGACGSARVWHKPGITPAEYARDREACRPATVVPYTKLAPGTGWLSRTRVGTEDYAACLRARGYRLVPAASRG